MKRLKNICRWVIASPFILCFYTITIISLVSMSIFGGITYAILGENILGELNSNNKRKDQIIRDIEK